MPPSSWHPTYELLTRHGIDHIDARSSAINDLRSWELDDIAAILERIQRPSRDYCYFRTPYLTLSTEAIDFRKWWPSLWSDTDVKWVSPPRVMMKQAARDELALCVNEAGEWSLRTSGYVALSHVWIEGLQRNNIHDGVEHVKFKAIFDLFKAKQIKAEWVWGDVLAIPAGGLPTTAIEDEMLTIDTINQLPNIYSRADAVIIIDALVLQLHPKEPLDVAVVLACGKWVTRVWTFQEIKLANRALVVTATGTYDYKELVSVIKSLEDQDYKRYHWLWLRLGIMMRDEARGLSIPDIVMACGTRSSGQDIDYARAFFPVLGLKWEYGMTREQGMQKIYTSFKRHASRVACFYGAPRMSIWPRWAPSYFHDLEGYVTESMEWEDRGIRGEWYAVKIAKVEKTFRNAGRFVFDFDIDCGGDRYMQCACAINEDEKAITAFETAIERRQCYVLSAQPSKDSHNAEWARTAILVEQANVNEYDGFEVAVYCAATIVSRSQHSESKRTVLLRHYNPTENGDLVNQIHYMWHTQKGGSQPSSLPRQEGESELHAAVRSGNLAAVNQIVEKGESIGSFDSQGWSPLHTAAARGETEILRYLLSRQPDIEVRGHQLNEDTPLSLAAECGQAESIRILLQHGANIHTRNRCDYTPIMVAAYERRDEAIKALLEGGAKANDEAGLGGTPLLLTSGAGTWRIPTMKALIEGGANVNPVHSHGITAMHNIAQWGSAEEMAYLIEQGCDVDDTQWNGWTPLHYAIEQSKRECVRLLLDAGADCDTPVEDNFRPIHSAAKCTNWPIMQMLLEQDLEIDAKTESQGWTALHVAYEANNVTIVKMLLKAGANSSVKDATGKKPSELAPQLSP